MPSMDLNADLAENEPPDHTAAVMGCLSSANIACAGHAGSPEIMRHAIEVGHSLGVRLGAHPGLEGDFGRILPASFSPQALHDVLDQQLDLFLHCIGRAGATPHHIKLHGALYHATESSPALRETFVAFVATRIPTLIIYARAGGRTVAAARAAQLQAWDEAFLDRAYLEDGSLLPRSHPSALITDPQQIADRAARFARHQPIPTAHGPPITLLPQTLCLHSDSPNSLALIRAAKDALHQAATSQ